jgi:hypothetical protein
MIVKTSYKCFERKKEKKQHRYGLVLGLPYLMPDCWLEVRISVIFLGPRANADLVPKFHVALHASHAAFAMVT